MTRIFLDTNVILDLLAERIPFYDSIAKIATLADQKKLTIVASGLSFVTVGYVLQKYEPTEVVLNKLRKLKIICEISDVNDETVEKALNSGFSDFEDAVQYYSAIQSSCSIIISRDKNGFKNSAISVMTANEYLSSIR